MNTLLEKAFHQASTLPEQEQVGLAEQILQQLTVLGNSSKLPFVSDEEQRDIVARLTDSDCHETVEIKTVTL